MFGKGSKFSQRPVEFEVAVEFLCDSVPVLDIDGFWEKENQENIGIDTIKEYQNKSTQQFKQIIWVCRTYLIVLSALNNI